MASLTGNSVGSSYLGLLKTDDNASISAVAKALTDGAGNALTMAVSTTGINFSGNVDFSAATVSGLPGGAAGLESGTGTDSMQSAASLTTIPASAQGANSIALGQSTAYANNSIVIGNGSSDADAVRVNSITIGNNINTAQYTVNIGNDQNAYGADGVCIGNSNVFGENFNVVVGYGNLLSTYPNQGIIGSGNTSQLAGAFVIGTNLTAVWNDAVHVNQLAMLNYANLNYADNAAAASAGLPLGAIYHTDGVLKVRHT